MKVVTGVYHDAERVTDAVRALLGRSVPVDSISVVLRDPAGGEREVPVEDEAGTLKGVAVGAGVGGALGGLGVGLAATGAVVSGGTLLAAGPLLAVLQGVIGGAAAGAVAGIPLGGVLGLGRWRAKPELDADELARGTALVCVHSDKLAADARRVFEETGADEIREDEDEADARVRS